MRIEDLSVSWVSLWIPYPHLKLVKFSFKSQPQTSSLSAYAHPSGTQPSPQNSATTEAQEDSAWDLTGHRV